MTAYYEIAPNYSIFLEREIIEELRKEMSIHQKNQSDGSFNMFLETQSYLLPLRAFLA